MEPIKKSGKEKRAIYSQLDDEDDDAELLALRKRSRCSIISTMTNPPKRSLMTKNSTMGTRMTRRKKNGKRTSKKMMMNPRTVDRFR